MNTKSLKTLIFIVTLGYFGYAISSTTPTEDVAPAEDVTSTKHDITPETDALTGNSEVGETIYNKTCINCHGAGGKGVASYPKVSGNEIAYTTSKLETYRDGIKIGPNSFLMIMNAKPLTDEDIANLAAYLKDATYK